MNDGLFDQIVAICDVSFLIGPGLVRRALRDQHEQVDTASIDSYRRALPNLQARLAAYLTPEEATQRCRKIAVLLHQSAIDAAARGPISRRALENETTAPRSCGRR
jgi:Ni,Fe-hydrogenase III large subunit